MALVPVRPVRAALLPAAIGVLKPGGPALALERGPILEAGLFAAQACFVPLPTCRGGPRGRFLFGCLRLVIPRPGNIGPAGLSEGILLASAAMAGGLRRLPGLRLFFPGAALRLQ